MSDRGIPRSLRMIEGFGIHSYRLINKEGKSTFMRFHWKPVLGVQSTTWDEAVKISGADPDYHRRDLFESINNGDYPEWEFGVQLFTEDEARPAPPPPPTRTRCTTAISAPSAGPVTALATAE